MAEKKNENTAAEPRFTKENLLCFEQYRNRRDLLYVLLEEERQYTTAEVDALIQKFMKGRVSRSKPVNPYPSSACLFVQFCVVFNSTYHFRYAIVSTPCLAQKSCAARRHGLAGLLRMALGGGTFLVQNKVLPGAYINFVSAARASAALSDRGIATMPLELDWCADGEVFTVENSEFQKDSMKIFCHAYTDEAMKPLRELFANARKVLLFKLNTGGAKAANAYAEAKYSGTRGNALKILIEKNEAFVETENEVYNVSTYLDTSLVDTQKAVKTAAELKANDFVTFKAGATLAETAATPLTGGTNGTVENAAYQTYLDKIEPYTFHAMGCASANEIIKGLFAAFTKRMRDECGVKFQTVLFRYAKADYEGVISVENGLNGAETDSSMIYWATGAEAGCAVNKSLTNTVYTGEYDVYADYTQTQLEDAVKKGKLMFHKVDDAVRLLTDINTFTSVTDEKSIDFGSNQTMRVLDQIGNDIASLFATKYLGKVQNDNAGRISLWNDIVKHHTQLQTIRAIENFSGDNVTVEKGDSKKSVVVIDRVTPVNAMEQLYQTVIVE